MNFALYLVTVIGFFVMIIISMSIFIHYLRVGLDSRSSRVVDPMPQLATADTLDERVENEPQEALHKKSKNKKR